MDVMDVRQMQEERHTLRSVEDVLVDEAFDGGHCGRWQTVLDDVRQDVEKAKRCWSLKLKA